MTKIAQNTLKVSMHSYLTNAPINLRLNFSFEKLLKRETPLRGFAKVWIKGGENILECLKSLHACLFIESETSSCGFDTIGLKGDKMARNVTNVGVHACLSNMHPNI